MTDQNPQASETKGTTIKTLVITILTTLLISCGLVAAFGNYLKNLFIAKTTVYTCNILLKNGVKTNLPGVSVTLNGVSKSSDDGGTVIFKLKADIYQCSFTYGNSPHAQNFVVKSDTTLIFDIGRSLTDPGTGKSITSNLSQPNKNEAQRTLKIPNAIKIIATQENKPAAQTNAAVDMPDGQLAATALSANEILHVLQLRVRIDSTDSYRGKGKQFAYHYYLSGNPAYLSRVVQVLYQRNDPTFAEFKNHEFNVSDDVAAHFEYIGYQWGSVSSTYVQIVLDNSKSDIFLKSIVYDK